MKNLLEYGHIFSGSLKSRPPLNNPPNNFDRYVQLDKEQPDGRSPRYV